MTGGAWAREKDLEPHVLQSDGKEGVEVLPMLRTPMAIYQPHPPVARRVADKNFEPWIAGSNDGSHEKSKAISTRLRLSPDSPFSL